MKFDRWQIRDFVKQTKSEWGLTAWHNLGERFQRALIAERALKVVQAQARSSIEIDEVDELVASMNKEAFER